MYFEDIQRLSWKSFNTAILAQQADLFKQRKYADVTIVSDDLVQNPVHKHVMAASSSFLECLLDITQENSPLLYIKGVPQAVLESIIKFVYLGEVSIKTQMMSEFLRVGEELGISVIKSATHVQAQEEFKKKENIVKTESIPTMDFLQTSTDPCFPNKPKSKKTELSFNDECQDMTQM